MGGKATVQCAAIQHDFDDDGGITRVFCCCNRELVLPPLLLLLLRPAGLGCNFVLPRRVATPARHTALSLREFCEHVFRSETIGLEMCKIRSWNIISYMQRVCTHSAVSQGLLRGRGHCTQLVWSGTIQSNSQLDLSSSGSSSRTNH